MFFNPNLVSQCARNIYNNGFGFRNEAYSGSRKRLFKNVLEYETNELGNKDIYLTIRQAYANIAYRFDLRRCTKALNKQVIETVTEYLKCEPDELRCIWVCDTLENAIAAYGNEDLKKVVFNDRMMIISDLGLHGTLVVCRDINEFNT